MNILKHDAYITGTVEPGEVYNVKKTPYEDFWSNQKSYKGDLFIACVLEISTIFTKIIKKKS